MSGIQIYEDETFDAKRPGLNQDGDKSLDVVYATSDWGVIQKPEKPKPQPTPTREPEPQPTQPKVEPELPQPKPEDKPSATPQPEVNFASQVYDELKTKVQDVDGQKQLSPNDFSVALDSLRKRKISDWSNRQREIGKNTTPGEGTRRRIEKDAEIELYNELKKDNVVVAQTPLQESISRIKTLIFF
jgi:outer membrane biosynthesis protein TonB